MNASSKIASVESFVTPEIADLVRGSLAPKNSVGRASVDFYVAVLASIGVDPESLSFAETVEVTRRLYAESADYRRAIAEISSAEREAEKAEAKKAAEAKRLARLEKDREAIRAKAIALGIVPSDVAPEPKK